MLVGFPEEAILEMDEFGKDFMPDVPSWDIDAPDPREDPLMVPQAKSFSGRCLNFSFSFFSYFLLSTCKGLQI